MDGVQRDSNGPTSVVAAPSSSSSSSASSAAVPISNLPPPFLCKTYDVVDDPLTDSIVSWSNGNNSFVVWNVPEFSRDLLPKYFKHNNFSSFVRQLNTYGFRKVDPDRWEFANEGFLRGQKHLLKTISRRKPAHVNSQQQPPQVQSAAVGPCVEVGKFGLEEEVERLKRDKNVLMQELVRLKQQQQATDHQLQTVGQRVQIMEERQQQMMSFLAKAMQSPGFLSQLVQHQTESNRRITSGANKKRRLPNQDEESLLANFGTSTPNGRIVKYQPLMNEAAKAMLRQILKMNVSSHRDPSVRNPDAFLIDDVPSSLNSLDSGSSSSRISGVTLSEVPPTSSVMSESGYPVNCVSAAISEIQSCPGVLPDPSKADGLMNMLNSGDDTAMQDFAGMQEIMQEGATGLASGNFSGSAIGNAGYVEPTASVEDPTMDNLLDEIPKLPGIDDVFWEQFLTTSPLTEETGEISDDISDVLEDGATQELDLKLQREKGWDKTHHVNQLTEQLGFLTSATKMG